MVEQIAGILGFITFASIFLSALADTILSLIWAKGYFTSGVLLFSQSISVNARHTNIPSADLLNKRLYSFLMGGFVFRELDGNTHGFRRKFFSFSPKPMLHGSINFDFQQNLVIVKGYPDWFMVAFSIMWLLIVPLMRLAEGVIFDEQLLLLAVGYVAFYGLIVGILYVMDYYRLKYILAVAVELWNRKHVAE